MIKRSHIRQFLALADTGSFTQAANRLGVTQPTLSAGIADLETIVGARLFDRNRRGVRLTSSGGQFIPMARDLENRFREVDTFGQSKSPPQTLLRVGTIRTVSTTMLDAFLAPFAAAFTIDLAEGADYDLRAALTAGRLDLALTVLRPAEAGAAIWPAFEEAYIMFAGVGHRLAGRKQVPAEEFSSETMIARRSCEVLSETSRFFTRHGVRPRFSFKSDNDDRCLAMVAAGIGITTAPASLTREGLMPVEIAGYDLRRRIGVLARDDIAGMDSLDRQLDVAVAAVAQAANMG